MNIILSGSLGNIGKPLTEQLVAAGHNITVISSTAERKAAIEALGAKAAIGSVSDAAFLTAVFKNADAVFAMTPPNLGGANVLLHTANAGTAFAQAIRETAVPHVVMLSSIGADKASGNGPIAGLHQVELEYQRLPHSAVTFLRAGYFYTNLYNDIPLIKGLGIIGANYPAETRIPLVHPADIAAAAASALQTPATGQQVQYIVSDLRPASDIAACIGKAIGKPGLNWVAFSDEQSLQGMTDAGLPAEIAGLYMEMGQGIRNGSIQEDFINQQAPVSGKTKLEDFALELASRY